MSNLDLWESFFSLHLLLGELYEKPNQQLQNIDFSERTKQVDQMLEKATSLSETLVESRAQVDNNKLDAENKSFFPLSSWSLFSSF